MRDWIRRKIKDIDIAFAGKIVFYAFTTMVAALTVWICLESPVQRHFKNIGKNDVWFGDGWHYDDSDMEPVAVSEHYLRLRVRDESIVISKTLDFTPASEEYLCFRARAQDVTVYVNGRVWYQSSFQPRYRAYANQMYMLHQVSVDGMRKGDVLTIAFGSVSDSRYMLLQFPSMGDRYALIKYIMGKSGKSLTICLAVLLLIMVCLITSFSPALVGKSSRDIRALRRLTVFLVLSVVYLGTDCGCMELFIERTSIISWLGGLSLLMLPIPFILFTKYAFFPGHKRYNILAGVNILLVTISCICFVFFAYNMANFFLPAYALIALDIIACVLSFWQEKMTPSWEVVVGFAAIMVTVPASIVAYWTCAVYPASVLFGFGPLVFGVCMLVWVVRSRHEFNSMREEAAYVVMQREKQAAEEASEQKSRFLSHMSHEIRTPLNAIIGMNELVMRETKNDDIKKYADNIQSASRTLLALVNDVLDFSKIETGKMDIIESDYSLSSVLNDVVLMTQSRVEDKGLTMRLDIDSSLPDLLHGDEIRIKQVILNLMTNAVKYTPSGWMELVVRRRPASEYMDDENILLEIRVSDSGMGIREEELSKLFVEFERLDRQRNKSIEGTGLGLAITSRLVALMHGTITVESEYGKGTTFLVTIPQRVVSFAPIGDYKKRFAYLSHENAKKNKEKEEAAQEEAAQEQNAEGDETQVPAPLEIQSYPGKRVFVVDDNEMNLEVIASILEMLEIQVERANGGQAAIDSLAHDAYDLILTDDMMPEVSGTDLMLYLHAHAESANHATPIVVLTANAVAGVREEYITKGFDDYMSKPIDIDVLQKILMKYLK